MNNSLRGKLVTAMTAGALLVLPMSNGRVTRAVSRAGATQQSNDPKTLYAPQQKEFWLSEDEFGYIRPGLKITVNSITINDDSSPGRGHHVHGRSRQCRSTATA